MATKLRKSCKYGLKKGTRSCKRKPGAKKGKKRVSRKKRMSKKSVKKSGKKRSKKRSKKRMSKKRSNKSGKKRVSRKSRVRKYKLDAVEEKYIEGIASVNEKIQKIMELREFLKRIEEEKRNRLEERRREKIEEERKRIEEEEERKRIEESWGRNVSVYSNYDSPGGGGPEGDPEDYYISSTDHDGWVSSKYWG